MYGEDSERRAGLVAWVRRGLDLDAKILCTEPPGALTAGSVAGLLRDDPEALAAMGRGQVEVVPADRSAYEPAFVTTVVERALREGYPCVRWAGDATTAWRLMSRRRHRLVEQATDRLCRTRPLSVLCQYPHPEAHRTIGFLGRAHASGMRGELFQVAWEDGGLAVAGELDITNHHTLRHLLETTTSAARSDPFVLDLSGVSFLDLPGARALLLGTLDHRNRGGRVRVQAAQPHVAELVRLLGIDEVDGILLEGEPQ